jgi:hypothetical protein
LMNVKRRDRCVRTACSALSRRRAPFGAYGFVAAVLFGSRVSGAFKRLSIEALKREMENQACRRRTLTGIGERIY